MIVGTWPRINGDLMYAAPYQMHRTCNGHFPSSALAFKLSLILSFAASSRSINLTVSEDLKVDEGRGECCGWRKVKDVLVFIEMKCHYVL